MIVGYSLAHNQPFAPIYAASIDLLQRVNGFGIIEDVTQAIMGQKCLNTEYQKDGLMVRMDRILHTHLSTHFKFYVATIALTNRTSLDFVTNSGYKRVYDTDERAYFLIDIKPSELTEESYTSKKKDGSVIHYRFATATDIQELKQMNCDWMKENRKDLSYGYLSAQFSEDNWQYMTDRKWVVIAEVDDLY